MGSMEIKILLNFFPGLFYQVGLHTKLTFFIYMF